MKTNTELKVREIIESISGQKIGAIDFSGDIREQINLDSMQFIEFFSALELEFDVELPLELINVKSVKEFITVLESTIQHEHRA